MRSYESVAWFAFIFLATVACSAAQRSSSELQKRSFLVHETFAFPDSIRRDWLAILPDIVGATVSIEDEAVRFSLPSQGEIKLARLLDVTALRGKRLRVFARVRTDSPGAIARLSMSTSDVMQGAGELIWASPVSGADWSAVTAVVDIAPDAPRVDLAAVLRGQGNAWFDDVSVEIIGQAPKPSRLELSTQQVENLAALTRAAALIRYRHPSDQSATLDWNAFLPVAIERVIRVRDRRALLAELRDLFKLVAPTVEFSESPTYTAKDPPRAEGEHLARWRSFGLGLSAPSLRWREGRDVDQANVRVEVVVETPTLSRCKRGRLKAGVRRLGNEGEISVYADISQPGDASKWVDQRLAPAESAIAVDFDMPADAYNVRLGVQLRGLAGLELEHLSLTCDEHDRSEIEIERAPWLHRGTGTLYSYEVATCRSRPCLVVRRKPLDTVFDKARDLIDVEISSRLWMHMPLAVWTDGRHTLPEGATWKSSAIFGATDVPTRLAILASAWGTMSLFYPYMADLGIDWQRELPLGLVRMARAQSTVEIVAALYRSLVALRDNHIRISHPDFRVDGMLPIALRRFDKTLVVVGAYGDYAKRAPVGTEILEFDHISALRAYDDMAVRIPSATVGWSTIIVPFWLTLGRLGTFSRLKIKTPDGSVSELVLPYISRALYEFLVQEHRPAFGAELASGVFYIPLEGLKKESWHKIVPSLTTARTIILDMRGYPTSTVFGILGHFSDTEIRSPDMQYLLLGSNENETPFWTIRPMKPRLRAKVICLLDGRAVSAAETVLQIIHDHHLAALVGEPSAGTNGNVTTIQLSAGFSMRFTGMRVLLRDGTAIQGRGIMPDHVVHPTLEGMRAGRDEILEAALSLAERL